jgi:excisionase family DNA binding protein
MHKHLLTPLLTRREVAKALGVSVQTVGRIIERGELETVRVGKRFIRIPAETLQAYLDAEVEEGGAE